MELFFGLNLIRNAFSQRLLSSVLFNSSSKLTPSQVFHFTKALPITRFKALHSQRIKE